MVNMQEISLKAEEIFKVGGFTITNSLLLTFMVTGILVVLSLVIYKKINIVPGKLQSLVEVAIEKLMDLMKLILGSVEPAEKYLPLIATIFIFIMFSNIIGVL